MNLKIAVALGVAAIALPALFMLSTSEFVGAAQVGHETISATEHISGTTDACVLETDPFTGPQTGTLFFEDLNGDGIHDHTSDPATAEPEICVIP